MLTKMENEKERIKIKVLYHTDADGACAAWVVYNYYIGIMVRDTERVYEFSKKFVNYGQPAPLEYLDKDTILYIVDFSYDLETLKTMESLVKEIHVFDHHASVPDEVKQLPYFVYSDNSKGLAGAGLTWSQLFPDIEPPMIVKLVDDRDLWKFEYGDKTKWFHEYLMMHDIHDLTLWDFLTNEEMLESKLAMGRAYHEATMKRIENFVKKKVSYSKIPTELLTGHELLYGEHKKEYAVAVYNTGELISEIGSTVLTSNKSLDFSICWLVIPEEDKVVFSLRSKGDKVNVSELAKLNGGGGHFNAAGFHKSIEDGLELIKIIYKYIML